MRHQIGPTSLEILCNNGASQAKEKVEGLREFIATELNPTAGIKMISGLRKEHLREPKRHSAERPNEINAL